VQASNSQFDLKMPDKGSRRMTIRRFQPLDCRPAGAPLPN